MALKTGGHVCIFVHCRSIYASDNYIMIHMKNGPVGRNHDFQVPVGSGSYRMNIPFCSITASRTSSCGHGGHSYVPLSWTFPPQLPFSESTQHVQINQK